jgi:hypothetical protein
MADNEDATGSPAGDETPEPTAGSDVGAEATADTVSQPVVPPAGPQPVLVTRWRDRAWSFRSMIAVALASLLVGGLAGGAIMAASGDDDDRGHFRMGPYGPGGAMPPGWRGDGPGFNDGGPRWRWNDGPQTPPASPSSPGSTG